MMHIAYTLAPSKYHGIGLFTTENLKKGQLIYTASPALDVNLTQVEFEALSAEEQTEVKWWGFFDKPSQKWHVDFDVSKFVNHSYEPTITQDPSHTEAYLVAARDVRAGEELTQNYLEFEAPDELLKRGIPPQS